MADTTDDSSKDDDRLDDDLFDNYFEEDEGPRDPLEVLADYDADSEQGQLEWRGKVSRNIL